jgi:hypothetical protein
MLFRPAPVKPIWQGHQAGQGANQPSHCQHHQNQPWADWCIQVCPPLSNLIAQMFTLHFEANSFQVIAAVLTIAVYFYLGGLAVALGSTQLAYFHAIIVFTTFVPWFFDQKWELPSFWLSYWMSVQVNFFLPRDLDEDSIPNQGVEGAAGDPQVIVGSSLAGGHQGSAAGSSWIIDGWGQPPPNIGHVP